MVGSTDFNIENYFHFFNGQISMLYPEKIGVDFQTSFVLLIVGVGRLPCSIAHRGGMDTSTLALWEDVGGITLIRLVFYGKKTSALCHLFHLISW